MKYLKPLVPLVLLSVLLSCAVAFHSALYDARSIGCKAEQRHEGELAPGLLRLMA